MKARSNRRLWTILGKRKVLLRRGLLLQGQECSIPIFLRLPLHVHRFPFQARARNSDANTTVLKAPTGLGKTDSVSVSWLHRRVTKPAATPWRLAWCLPGRALTEQVAAVAEVRIQRLAKAGLLEWIKVYRLLGGSQDDDAKLRPDEEAILVGTQDILLSRALKSRICPDAVPLADRLRAAQQRLSLGDG